MNIAHLLRFGAIALALACSRKGAPSFPTPASTRRPLNSPDESTTPTAVRCRPIIGAPLQDSARADLLRAVLRDSSPVELRAARTSNELLGVRTFEGLETRACDLFAKGRVLPQAYTAFIDSVVPVVLASATDGMFASQRPRLAMPASGSRFDHYPRRTEVVWHSVPGADHYLLEVQALVQVYRRAASTGGYVAAERRWSPHNDGLHSAVVSDTAAIFFFIGAQPGRWRVRAIAADGRSTPASEWWLFEYGR